MSNCHCGNAKSFDQCCGPFISGKQNPESAEQLMRSRYSAYVEKNIDYISNTHDPDTKEEFDLDGTKEWAEHSDWLGLEILDVEDDFEGDNFAKVEFVAKYKINGKDFRHREVSEFNKVEGKWYFTDGQMVQETIKREGPKVGRNDPCTCGSGKKLKKCCGR